MREGWHQGAVGAGWLDCHPVLAVAKRNAKPGPGGSAIGPRIGLERKALADYVSVQGLPEAKAFREAAAMGHRSAADVAMPPNDNPITPLPTRLADDDRKRKNDQGGPGTAVITKTRPQTKRPNLYRVLLLNDDYTPMEFVVHVLERFFNKDHEAAHRIMMHVHQHGIGECGVFTYEVAETKVTQVMDFARKHQHPLQCIMEKK
jgi:ATP-dependent Clp protease adaptor protein ClpS